MKKTNTSAIVAVMAVFLFLLADPNGAYAAGLVLGDSDVVTWKSYAIAITAMSLLASFLVMSAVIALSKRS
jgi:hypothetical protein